MPIHWKLEYNMSSHDQCLFRWHCLLHQTKRKSKSNLWIFGNLRFIQSQKFKKTITDIAIKFRQYLKAVGNDSQDCDDCKAIIEFIEGFLTNGMSIQQIDTMIKNYVCANLGAEQNLCDEIINQIPVLVDYITKHMSKEGICAEIGICSE